MNLFADIGSQAMFALGVVMLIVILLRRTFRYQKKNKKVSADEVKQNAERMDKLAPNLEKPLMGAPQEAIRWQVEMHELSREMKAELDTKMMALQTLIAMAKSETEKLQAAIKKAEKLGVAVNSDALSEIAELQPPSNAAPQAPQTISDKSRKEIKRLLESGKQPVEIAEELEIALGDIELILSLRPTR